MPPAPSTTADAIVLKLLASGEKFVRVSALTLQHGLVHLLARRRSKPPLLIVDLYDSGQAQIELKPEGAGNGFLKDFELSQRRLGIARNYANLQAAARLSAFFLANPVHSDNERSVFRLAEKALDALERNHPPEATLLKTFYTYSREEGYPVLEDWARKLDPSTRALVIYLLNTPLAELATERSNHSIALESLVSYIERETHIRLN